MRKYGAHISPAVGWIASILFYKDIFDIEYPTNGDMQLNKETKSNQTKITLFWYEDSRCTWRTENLQAERSQNKSAKTNSKRSLVIGRILWKFNFI